MLAMIKRTTQVLKVVLGQVFSIASGRPGRSRSCNSLVAHKGEGCRFHSGSSDASGFEDC